MAMINLLYPLLTRDIPTTMSDEDVIKEYLATQNSAYFNVLYKRYSGKIFGKCISLLKEEARAADATQEIFMKILLNLSKFSGKSKFSTWIYSITYNFCIDVIRRAKKDLSLLVDDIESKHDVVDDVEDTYLLELKVSRLKVILEEIPTMDKSFLLMKYQDDLSIREISEITKKSESAVKMKIKRAKQKFKKTYREIYKEE